MKPAPFDYFAPETLDEALALRAEHGRDSAVLAGGQSLMPLLNLRRLSPKVLIDLRLVPALDGIRELDGGVAIGTMTRQRTAERSELVGARCPLLVQALAYIAHPAIRNRGTIGGSLAFASPSAELPAAALVLNARMVARSVRGERVIEARDFFTGLPTTALKPDELLVEIEFPGFSGGAAFVEINRRHNDVALVAVAALVRVGDDGTIADASLGFAGVADAPIRSAAAEALLIGEPPSPALFAEAASTAVATLDPRNDLHASGTYRRRVAGVLTRRALVKAAA